MKTPRTHLRGVLACALALGMIAVTAPRGLQAQDRDAPSCRCVDRDGNEIERCTCFRRNGPSRLFGELVRGENRARLGITVDPDQRAEYDQQGARITDLLEDGPADAAGLREGDIVTHVDGRSLFDALDRDVERDFDLDESIPVQRLLAIVRDLEPDTEVEIGYLRDGEARTITLRTEELEGWGPYGFRSSGRGLELAERLRHLGDRLRFDDREGNAWGFALPGREGRIRVEGGEGGNVVIGGFGDAGYLTYGDERFQACPGRDREDARHVMAWASSCIGGLELVELRPGLAEYFGTEGGTLVADVHPDSPLGLQPGDVILRIGSRRTDSPERVRRVLRSYEPQEEITLHIMRRSREISVQGRLLVN